MIRVTSATLAGRAGRLSARIALSRLDEAVAAEVRMADPRDAEALHDLRVSLRRLRTCLRAYRPWLREAVADRLQRRLRTVAADTGAGRDAEVQAAYLHGFESRGPRSRGSAAGWLRERVETRQAGSEDGAQAVARARTAFRGLEPELRQRLSASLLRPRRGTQPQPSFARVTGDLVLKASSKLQRRLASIRSARDVKRAHRARIAGKRLRYLMEPLRRRSAAWGRCLTALKGLQDTLGELHDMHVLSAELASLIEKLAAEEARRRLRVSLGEEPAGPAPRYPLPGLLGLARAARRREDRLYARHGRTWGESRRARFFGELSSLAESLRGTTPAPRRSRSP